MVYGAIEERVVGFGDHSHPALAESNLDAVSLGEQDPRFHAACLLNRRKCKMHSRIFALQMEVPGGPRGAHVRAFS